MLKLYVNHFSNSSRYLEAYKPYQDLLTGKADTENANFLQEFHALSSFSKV